MLRRPVCVFVSLFLLSAFPLLPAGDPAKASMDASVLARIPARMKAYVDQGVIPGAVTLVQRKGVLAALDAVGMQDMEAKKPMQTDSIFQIMSMTKPFTGVAIMMLVEEGKLRLNDPVEKHLPEFRDQWVIESKTNTTRSLRKPARPITIRDLMSHTSGMQTQPPPGIADLYARGHKNLAEAVSIFSQQPLEFDPGTRWLYSNMGIDTLGRIVEVASDTPFEKFLETRIFVPLGMKDSHIFLPADKQARLAPVYAPKDGAIAKMGPGFYGGDPMNYRKGSVYSGPAYALYSTAPDLARFYQMMLNKGTLDGKRLLSPLSVDVMTSVHTGNLQAGHNPGTGFGLTWEVTRETAGTLTFQSVGTFGHGGAYGTYGWIDPKKELVGVFMIQFSGSRTDVRDAFVEIANSAVIP